MVSRLRVNEVESLSGVNKTVATLVDDLPNETLSTYIGTETLSTALNSRGVFVKTLSGLKAITPTSLTGDDLAIISGTLRSGMFVWVSGDQSANVSADPSEGVWVAPGSATSGASGAWKRLYDKLHPRFFGADPNVADNSTSLQNYFSFCVSNGEVIYLPKESYPYSTGISLTTSGSVTIAGEDKFQSRLVYSGSASNAITVSAGEFQGRDFAIIKAGGGMTSGGALEVDAERPSFERILVNSDTALDSWADFFLKIGGSESYLGNCSLLGSTPQQANLHGVVYDSASKSVSHESVGTIIYNCDRGFFIRTSTNPGAEGFRIFGGEVVNINVGVDARNTSVYTPPMLGLTGCHINSTGECVFAVGYQNVNIQGGLFYSTGNSFCYMENVTDFRCNGLTMVDQGGPSNMTGFTYVGTVLVIDTSNNYLTTTGIGTSWAYYQPTGNSEYVTVTNNKFNAAGTWQKSRDIWIGGDQPETYVHTGNIPKVADDIMQFVDQAAGDVNVLGTRAERINVTNVTSGTQITSLTGNNDGRIVILQCDTLGVEIVHSATLRLRPYSNFSMQAADKIWLVNNADGSWEELARTFQTYP